MLFKKICRQFLNFLPLLLIICGFILFFYFHLYNYLNLQFLRTHQELLNTWTSQNYFLAVFLFMLIYAITIALAIPSGFFFELVAGYLFGQWLATLYVSVCVTVGALILFLAVKLSLANWLEKKSSHKIKRIEQGLRTNAFNYIVMLRIIPVMPFWLVTIVCGLLKVPLPTFLGATFIGIVPPTFIYASFGASLRKLFAAGVVVDTKIILQPQFLFPLIALALLVILPIVYDYWNKRRN